MAKIGSSIGHYRLVEKIGEGGMGVVYRAEDEVLGRDIALKILPDAFAADAERLSRFEREARVLASLSHPNIASIHDLLEANGGHALVMELIDGPTLAERLGEGPLPTDQIWPLARQIAEGLTAAHEKGIIHRDLKPANVKITPEGRVKLLDFGLAKSADAVRSTSPKSGATVIARNPASTISGTLPYMAPEQLRGESTDARTDVYALGVLLYEMSAGKKPFAELQSARLIGDIQHTEPPPPRTINPEVPRRLEDIILKCLRKDPGQRYPSMTDFLRALHAASEAPSQRSLAVLYFENLGGAQDEDYFSDGITEDIIVELSRIQGLTVLSRSAVRAFRDSGLAVTNIGQKLDVAFVLGGSLRRAGDQLRITTQLVETRTGRSVWAERYDREIEDVFAIQDEIAVSIAGALRVVLSDAEKRALAKVPTRNVEAYEFYLRGRQHFQLFRRKSIEFARDEFARAIEADPNYAGAYAGLADCYSYLYMFWSATEENLVKADEVSLRGVELDPELAEAHVARGVAVSLGKQHEKAGESFETAIRLNPKLFEAHYFYARGYYARGKLDEAIYWFRRAMEVRPEDYQAPALLGSALAGQDRKEDSREAFRTAFERAQKHLDLQPGDTRAIYFSSLALCQLGEKREKSLELAARALAMDPDEPQVLYNVACVFALQGLAKQAVDCLTQVVSHGDWWVTWMKNDPDLAALHEDLGFQGLIKDT